MLSHITFIDLEPALVNAWKSEFSDVHSVSVYACDYFDIEADCLISPANSFGFMDGGLDRAIVYELGQEIEQRVQKSIVENYHGELPVGSAITIDTEHSTWPYLIAAPTMRVPEDVSKSLNAYLAFRAILLEIKRFNKHNPNNKIESIICPGLGTGVGRMSPELCAKQMRMAYEQVMGSGEIKKPKEIYLSQEALRSP